MKTKILMVSMLAATLAVSTACAQRYRGTRGDYDYGYSRGGYGEVYGGYVSQAPPAHRYERGGRPPGPGYVWCDGYWDWRGGRWFWMGGTWRRAPHARAAWSRGQWRRDGRHGYRWSPGRWR